MQPNPAGLKSPLTSSDSKPHLRVFKAIPALLTGCCTSTQCCKWSWGNLGPVPDLVRIPEPRGSLTWPMCLFMTPRYTSPLQSSLLPSNPACLYLLVWYCCHHHLRLNMSKMKLLLSPPQPSLLILPRSANSITTQTDSTLSSILLSFVCHIQSVALYMQYWNVMNQAMATHLDVDMWTAFIYRSPFLSDHSLVSWKNETIESDMGTDDHWVPLTSNLCNCELMHSSLLWIIYSGKIDPIHFWCTSVVSNLAYWHMHGKNWVQKRSWSLSSEARHT